MKKIRAGPDVFLPGRFMRFLDSLGLSSKYRKGYLDSGYDLPLEDFLSITKPDYYISSVFTFRDTCRGRDLWKIVNILWLSTLNDNI